MIRRQVISYKRGPRWRIAMTASLMTTMLLVAFVANPPWCGLGYLCGGTPWPVFWFYIVVSCAFFQQTRQLVNKGIRFDARTIAFPAHLWCDEFRLQARTKFKWSDLTRLELERHGSSSEEAMLVLHFGKNLVRLDLKAFESSDLRKLIDVLSAQCSNLPGIAERLRLIEEQLSTPHTFTRLWIDSLKLQSGTVGFIPLQIGQPISRFTVESQIAQGGFSSIYLVRDERSDIFVLKESVVTESGAGADKIRQFFQREAKILLQLKHPNIVKVIDHFIERDRDYLVLEYIPGQSLRQHVIEQGPLEERQALSRAKEVAEVLAYMHSHNPPVLHRDLTPDNLIIRDDGHLVVIDFGAANEYSGTMTSTLVGKQCYISAEQFKRKPCQSSDIYSLSATLYFMLTARDPDPLTVCRPKAIKSEVSTAVDDLVAACTQLLVADRTISSAEQFIIRVSELM